MSTKLRWGLLSTARINKQLMEGVHHASRSEVTAVASRNEEKANRYAREHNIPHAYGSYEAMLADDKIDVVYNSLPNQLHGEWTVKALEAGKHVLCEKPFASTREDLEAMIKAARTHGRVLAEAFMYLHHPQTKAVEDLLQSGKLGDLRTAQAAFHFKLDNMEDVRANADLGGGSIWDVGIYPISFFHVLAAQAPLEVFGRQQVGTTGVDMTFTGQLHFAGDFTAQFTSSFDTPPQAYVTVCGTQGKLELSRPFSGMDKGKVTFTPLVGEPQEITFPQEHLYLGEVQDMEAAVLDGKTPLISLERTASHVRTALALLESARSGQPVKCDWAWEG